MHNPANTELCSNSVDFKNLEKLYSDSNPIKLPAECYTTIPDLQAAIPYLQYMQILQKHGMMIITLDFDDHSGQILEKIANLLGNPHVHDSQGRAIWDVKVGGQTGTESLAKSHKLSEFIFHTDCSYEEVIPDYFGLYVVQHDTLGGGKNLIIDGYTLLQHLSTESFDALLNVPIKINVPEEFKKDKEFIMAPIIDQSHNIRYRHELIDFASLTDKQTQAIAELEKLIHSPLLNRSLSLKKRQIVLLDNKRYLHARTLIKDKNRHLKRIRFFAKNVTLALAV